MTEQPKKRRWWPWLLIGAGVFLGLVIIASIAGDPEDISEPAPVAVPTPALPLTAFGPGTYLVGRDIAPGLYRGEAGSDFMDSCYWARLAGLSGDLDDILVNANATGQFFVDVQTSDYALTTACELSLTQ